MLSKTHLLLRLIDFSHRSSSGIFDRKSYVRTLDKIHLDGIYQKSYIYTEEECLEAIIQCNSFDIKISKRQPKHNSDGGARQ